MNGLKRIQKEYKDLLKNPIDNITILPNPDNIYEWHYIIFGTTNPYTYGQYYGILTLDKDYPFKAPRIIMKTPNGRFKPDTRLCFSMSDYHQETWNPNWNIRTIMIGFYSFMLDESETEGSINCTYDERIVYADQSLVFNNSLETFKNIFNDNLPLDINNKHLLSNNENETNEEETNKDEINDDEAKICKFCYETTGELINACNCKGSSAYIHKECLNDWQLKTILNQSTHPKYQVNSDLICSVCNSEFKIKSKSREEIMSSLTGENIINQIKIGYIFISSKDSSEKNLELIKQYNDEEFYENILHWTYGVFIIVESNSGIIALNTNRNITKSNYFEMYMKCYDTYLQYYNLKNILHFNSIFIGGPCEYNSIFGLIYIEDLPSFNVNLKNVKIIKNEENKCVIFGEYYLIYKLYHVKPENVLKLHIYLGYAGWFNTQLISEFAKTSWGITNVISDILFKNNNYELIKQENCLFVKSNIYSDNN